MSNGVYVLFTQWYTPSEALQLHADSKIVITPPQFVDIHRLKRWASLSITHTSFHPTSLKLL